MATAISSRHKLKSPPEYVLGIEGGGTQTSWALFQNGRLIRQGKAGSGNTLLLSDAQLAALFSAVRAGAGRRVEAIGGAFAGCIIPREKNRVARALQKTWPQARRIVVGGDSESALAGCHGEEDGICVIAGTGSNVIAQKNGKLHKAGGWGHLFSDHGSGYFLARRGLELAYEYFDKTTHVNALGREFLRATSQNGMEEMVPWVLGHASKNEVAALAPCVFAAARKGDPTARQVLHEGASELARRVGYLIRRLGLRRPPVGLIGSPLTKVEAYRREFLKALNAVHKGCRVFARTASGPASAAALATGKRPNTLEAQSDAPDIAVDDISKAMTEQRNPRSRGLQKKSTAQLVSLFIDEEKFVQAALRDQKRQIVRACDLVSARLKKGGRLFYVGAGTSGRLGVVDSSEMPPTFNAPPEQIQAIMAGGAQAVFTSQEGAEDSPQAGRDAVTQRGVTQKDVVCGIAASGRTPFVLGALVAARKRGTATILLTCNPLRAPVKGIDVAIDLPTGPEIVTGSTRLKAGTATKLVLNMLSTIAMVRLGRVHDNLMIDVRASNSKLRRRAVGLVQTLTGCAAPRAAQLLQKQNWNVRRVVLKLGSP